MTAGDRDAKGPTASGAEGVRVPEAFQRFHEHVQRLSTDDLAPYCYAVTANGTNEEGWRRYDSGADALGLVTLHGLTGRVASEASLERGYIQSQLGCVPPKASELEGRLI